jgi:hypothetical protein
MKKSNSMYFLLAILAMFLVEVPSLAQEKVSDTLLPKKRNILSYNLTAPILFGWDNIVFGYERIVKRNQSFSVMAGYRGFPEIIDPDSSWLVDEFNKLGGFSISADYRFYLSKRNKFHIPDGVYIGPYFNYYTSSFNMVSRLVEEGDIYTNFDADVLVWTTGVGIEFGYQFVFWDKMALDLVLLGPGYAWYMADLKLTGEAGIVEDSELYNKLMEMTMGKLDFLKIIDQEFKATGSGRTGKLGLGYRYLIRVGWYF